MAKKKVRKTKKLKVPKTISGWLYNPDELGIIYLDVEWDGEKLSLYEPGPGNQYDRYDPECTEDAVKEFCDDFKYIYTDIAQQDDNLILTNRRNLKDFFNA